MDADPEQFRPVPEPGSSDWLANHEEHGQTFEEFQRCRANVPTAERNVIYIASLTMKTPDEGEVPHAVISLLAEYATIFFGFPVKQMQLGDALANKVRTRINQFTGRPQAHAADILRELATHVPANAFTLGAITTCDLYPRDSWNFVFGLADLRARVGVYSLARYLPDLYMGIPASPSPRPSPTGPTPTKQHPNTHPNTNMHSSEHKTRTSSTTSASGGGTGTGAAASAMAPSPTSLAYPGATGVLGSPVNSMLLMRACRLMAHEFSHTFGLLHCVFYHCLMNGR